MRVNLRSGRGVVTAELGGLRYRELGPTAPSVVEPLRQRIANALDRPAVGASLLELSRGTRRVVILVPDATRKAALPEVLPLVLERLALAGVATQAITVLVACGTHPPATGAELGALLGPLPGGVRVVQHDASAEESLALAGTLPTGLSVRLNRRILEADLVLGISAVQHHYFAGFGGGPKLVFPGVAGYEEIQQNHGRVIDLSVRPVRRNQACEPGRITGNPVAEEIAAAARLRPPEMVLLMVMGATGTPVWVEAGPLEAVYPPACAQVREWFEVEAGLYRRVIVSAGGYPSDHTLIQAHKALDAACRFAADGAEVVLVAACDGGAGSPAVAPFLADPRPEVLISRLAERYVQYGHTVLRFVEKTARVRVLAMTGLDDELVRRLGMRPVPDLAAIIDRWRTEDPHEPVAVMAGTAVYPR
jgi:nickel-dependent lactate racemase